MEWWNQLGAHLMLFSGQPALGVDMSLNGPQGEFGLRLGYDLQASPVPLEVYPGDEVDFSALLGG